MDAPDTVEMNYRQVGRTHVFSSSGIDGLVHVGSHDHGTARSAALVALSMHVLEVYGSEVTYEWIGAETAAIRKGEA